MTTRGSAGASAVTGPGMAVNRHTPNIGPRVSILTSKGELLARFGDNGAGAAANQFTQPWDVTVLPSGHVIPFCAYNVLYRDGHIDRPGRILAADFVIRNRRLQAFHFTDGIRDGYYAETGKSMKKAFRRSPVEFSRITSDYTLARFHPVLGLWRAHRGIDYAAPAGSRVMATAASLAAYIWNQVLSGAMRAAWKSIECGIAPPFFSVISTVWPSRTWTTGPGAPCPSNAQVLYFTPGAISTVLSTTTKSTSAPGERPTFLPRPRRRAVVTSYVLFALFVVLALSPSLEESARLLGHRPGEVFRTIVAERPWLVSRTVFMSGELVVGELADPKRAALPIIALEASVAVGWLGRVFERTDPASAA